jgi:hypothetical protein
MISKQTVFCLGTQIDLWHLSIIVMYLGWSCFCCGLNWRYVFVALETKRIHYFASFHFLWYDTIRINRHSKEVPHHWHCGASHIKGPTILLARLPFRLSNHVFYQVMIPKHSPIRQFVPCCNFNPKTSSNPHTSNKHLKFISLTVLGRLVVIHCILAFVQI